ncbi:MAG: tetratricopeptide repeat protein [Gluconacetobacter diazotrophicus]|nr:tetratricopeptide repeat protein [Gluconacetobacter diazotrophicus]
MRYRRGGAMILAPMLALGASLALGACADRTGGLRDTPSLGVADSALSNGDPDFALRIAQRMIAADPNNAAAWVRQGDAFAAMENPFQARGSYQKALALSPAAVGAQMGMGRLAIRSNPGEAVGWFRRVLERRSDQEPAANNDLGIALDLLGQHAAAQDSYRRALDLQPDLSAAQVNLGLSLALSGHAREGAAMIRPLAEGTGATPRMREDLATALLLDGQDDAARQVLSHDVPPERLDDSLRALRSLRSVPADGH